MLNENRIIPLIVVLYVMIVCDLIARYQHFEAGMETVCSSKTQQTMLCYTLGDCDMNFHHFKNFSPKNISLVTKSDSVFFWQCNDSDNLNPFLKTLCFVVKRTHRVSKPAFYYDGLNYGIFCSECLMRLVYN